MARKRRFRLIGRDAGTGRFKSLSAARRDKKGSIVQRVPIVSKRRARKKK